MSTIKKKEDALIGSFSSTDEWEKWLAANHAESDGIWLRMFKKESGERSITYR